MNMQMTVEEFRKKIPNKKRYMKNICVLTGVSFLDKEAMKQGEKTKDRKNAKDQEKEKEEEIKL